MHFYLVWIRNKKWKYLLVCGFRIIMYIRFSRVPLSVFWRVCDVDCYSRTFRKPHVWGRRTYSGGSDIFGKFGYSIEHRNLFRRFRAKHVSMPVFFSQKLINFLESYLFNFIKRTYETLFPMFFLGCWTHYRGVFHVYSITPTHVFLWKSRYKRVQLKCTCVVRVRVLV